MTISGGEICCGLVNPEVWGLVSVEGGYETLTPESSQFTRKEKKKGLFCAIFLTVHSSESSCSCSPSLARSEPLVSAGSQLAGRSVEFGGAKDPQSLG